MLKKTLILAILLVVGFCTQAEVQAVFAELENTPYGPLLSSFFEKSNPKEDMQSLLKAFDTVIASLEGLEKDEIESFKKADDAFTKFSTRLKKALGETISQLDTNNHKLLDEMVPHQEKLDRQIKDTEKSIPEVEGWIKDNEDKLTRLKSDTDNQNKNIQECIDAIDQAIQVLGTYSGSSTSLIEKKDALSTLFQRITTSSRQIQKVSYTHFLTSLSQITMHENVPLDDQETVNTVVELLNKIRKKLVQQLKDLDKAFNDQTDQILKQKDNNEKLLKKYQDQLVTLNDESQKSTGEIEAIKKVIKTYEDQKAKWTAAIDSLNKEKLKADQIHAEQKNSFADQIALVKKAKKVIQDEKTA